MNSTSTATPNATSTGEAPVTPLTASRLIEAPLPQLLAEVDAEVYDSSIIDDGFFGAAVQRKDGHIALAMPPGREEFERDTVARMLLGKVLGVELAPLPRWLRAEVIPA